MNFKEITSKSNSDFKKLVQMKKNRASDEFFVEGARYIKSAFEYGGCLPVAIFCDPAHKQEAAFLSKCLSCPPVLLTAELFSEVSETVHSQGILAVYSKSRFQFELAKCRDFDDDDALPFYLVLDEVRDPGNVGAVIRTADAAGIKHIFLVKGTADPYAPKASRASAGSVLNVKTYVGDREEILRFLKERHCDIVVTTIDGRDFRTYRPTGQTALVLGNEARGVHLEFVKNAEHRLGIPMRGGAESLNVAVAAGILIYYLRG